MWKFGELKLILEIEKACETESDLFLHPYSQEILSDCCP